MRHRPGHRMRCHRAEERCKRWWVVLLEVRDLVMHFPLKGSRAVVQAVNGVSFAIERGQTLGLIGESGSGKTTVGRCILKLIEPTAGDIVFDGTSTMALTQSQFRPFRRRIQMVFQDPHRSLNPRMSVRDTLLEPLMLHAIGSRRDDEARVRELVRRVELEPDDLRRFPHQLSGGQQQRVGIARAIATNPDLSCGTRGRASLDAHHRGGSPTCCSTCRRNSACRMSIFHDLTQWNISASGWR